MKPHQHEQELGGWLVSGYCVYSAAVRSPTGERLAAAQGGGRQSAVTEAVRGADC